VTGDAPQPGDKPRNEGEPWSYTDPNTAWWQVERDREPTGELAGATAARPRRPRRRRPAPTTPANAAVPPAYGGTEPAFAPEALDAHAAGAQDAAEALDPPPAVLVEAEQEDRIAGAEAAAAAEAVADARTGHAEPVAVEGDHDRPTGERPVDEDAGAGDPAEPVDVPDVMVLPEPGPNRNRPTVALDRGSVPGQPAGGLSRLGRARTQATEGVLDPVRAERLENSPFWLSDEERAAAGHAWPAADDAQRPADAPGPDAGRPPRRTPRTPRHPAPGLLGLIALSLVAVFFAWVSAEPFWLAVGHGDRGVATVGRCTGAGVTQRCSGAFTAADGSFAVERVTLLGVEKSGRNAGAVAPARMVSPDSRQAYVGVGPLVHLRWVLGFLLVLLCGYGIAGLTGARRLETARARRAAVLTSLAGPILLLVGFLAAAF
jgi:hypothetical protein